MGRVVRGRHHQRRAQLPRQASAQRDARQGGDRLGGRKRPSRALDLCAPGRAHEPSGPGASATGLQARRGHRDLPADGPRGRCGDARGGQDWLRRAAALFRIWPPGYRHAPERRRRGRGAGRRRHMASRQVRTAQGHDRRHRAPGAYPQARRRSAKLGRACALEPCH